MGTITNYSLIRELIQAQVKPQVKMKSFIFLVAYIGSIWSAPQYGNIGGQSQPQRGQSGSAVRCRTEQATIWDTTYVETKEKICTTLYVNQCQTLYQEKCRPPAGKFARQSANCNARLTTRRSAINSFERNMSLTLRLSVAPAIRRTVSTTGKELAMTRNGFQTFPLARTTLINTVRMWRNNMKDKWLTQFVTRFQSKAVSMYL